MRVLRSGSGWMEIEGDPLPDFLEDCVIINEHGEEIGKIEGFAVMAGQTMREAIEAALPPGCDLKYKPKPVS